ncbi:probable ATP-dependent RNA helicase DDX10, partial [Pecten maximus]|uniref:probable ATP-dependent RNA helicase DDX10 n=1 Tax=Pecten maximus TaxID=6579 RepID=UPI001457E5CE
VWESNFGKNKNKDAFRGHSGKVKKKQLYNSKEKKWKTIDAEIASLQERYNQFDSSSVEKFTDFPLSKRTLQGLELGKYESPTEIQKESIGLALQGNDILGAAKTGSGKTLAFLIPVLECLYRQKWSPMDGLGALIISPTRELAYQTFVVLRKIGKFQDFSAGLVIGGKLLSDEIGRMNRTNIVICTPGRLLQHMDETANFTADSLQILVLDEADRILDLGFAQSMNAIIENLPIARQTLLFSATQTRSVKDLARLSLQNPMYVSVHENAQHSTPTQLEQSYIVCELHDKINLLWSFIKNHLKSKTLVFLSSCKQVRYIHNSICQLRPGVSVLALHGAMNQLKRVAVYNEFCRKQNAILLATDIAARGLDFPAVKWVLQLDCPEDANTYIHRVGRTARYDTDGESLLVLLPSEEEAMVQLLEEKKIPIEKIKVNPKKLWSIQPKLENMCAADPHVKESAQKAFLSYLRSVFMMSNKKVFNIHALDTEKFSGCLGLAFPPRIRFLQREEKRLAEKAASQASVLKSKDNPGKSRVPDSGEEEGDSAVGSDSDSDMAVNSDDIGVSSSSSEEDSSESESESKQSKNRTEKNKKTRNTYLDKESNAANFDVEEEDEFLTVKKKHLPSEAKEDKKKAKSSEQSFEIPERQKKKAPTKFAMAKMIQKKNIIVNQKITFDEEGQAVVDVMKQSKVDEEPDEYEGGISISAAKKRMEKEDNFDKKLDRDRVLQKHREKRLKLKEEMRAKKNKRKYQDDEEEGEAVLGGDEDGANPLDFLPDPDKVYGPGGDSEEEEDEEEPEFEPVTKKQRLSNTMDSESDEYSGDEDVASGDDDDEDDDDEDEDDDDDNTMQSAYTLEDDEALALKLLGK